MSQMNPMLLASLAAATNAQANLSGPVTDENGQPVESARGGKPKDISDFVTHWDQNQRQAPTSANYARGQSPSMQYVASQIPERKSEDVNTSGDENGPDQFANRIQATGNGGYAIPTDISEQQALANSDPATAAAYKAMQAKNAATPATDWYTQMVRGTGPAAAQSIAGPAGNEVPTTQQAIAQAQGQPGATFESALRGIYNAGGTPQGPAAAISGFIKSANLSKDQQDSINGMVTAGSTPQQIVQSVKDYQQINHQADQQARQDWAAQRDLYRADYESSVRDYDATQKALDTARESAIGMANPDSLKPLSDAKATAKTAMDAAKKQWGDFTKAGPTANPSRVIQPSQRGELMNPQIITVRSADDYNKVPPGGQYLDTNGNLKQKRQ